jgi:hypothetical protein
MSGKEQLEFASFVWKCIQQPAWAALIQDMESDNIYEDEFKCFAVRFDAELYWRVNESSLSTIQILELIRIPILPYPWCGFIFRDVPLAAGGALHIQDLSAISQTLIATAVGAFDNDSFLLWWSNRVPIHVIEEV